MACVHDWYTWHQPVLVELCPAPWCVMSHPASLPAAQLQPASQPECCILLKAAPVAILYNMLRMLQARALLICLVSSCNLGQPMRYADLVGLFVQA